MSKILIIDDDQDYAESLEIALKAHSHVVAWASDSIEGMKMLEADRPDLIILDIIMTTMGEGLLLAYKLKSDPRYAKIPILILTGLSQLTGLKFDPQDENEFLPVDDYLEKSGEIDSLCAHVKRLLSKNAS